MMRLAIDLAVLCVIIAPSDVIWLFSLHGGLTHHFIVPHHPTPYTPIGVLEALASKTIYNGWQFS